MSITETRTTATFSLPQWSAAEFLDIRFSDRTILRALVCRLAPGEWQWSITSITSISDDSGNSGELIGVGVTKNVAEARQQAAAELDKCVRDPFC